MMIDSGISVEYNVIPGRRWAALFFASISGKNGIIANKKGPAYAGPGGWC